MSFKCLISFCVHLIFYTAHRKTKFFTFLLIPDNEKAAKSLKLGTSLLRFLIVFLVFSFLLIIAGAASYWKVAEVALDYNRLNEENIQEPTLEIMDKFWDEAKAKEKK